MNKKMFQVNGRRKIGCGLSFVGKILTYELFVISQVHLTTRSNNSTVEKENKSHSLISG